MEYTILILALPVLSFLILGLAGMYMKHRVAGLIGTLSLTGVTFLSYLTAYEYFTAPRTVRNVDALELPMAAVQHLAAHRHGNLARPDFRHDVGSYLYRQPDGAHLFIRLHER